MHIVGTKLFGIGWEKIVGRKVFGMMWKEDRSIPILEIPPINQATVIPILPKRNKKKEDYSPKESLQIIYDLRNRIIARNGNADEHRLTIREERFKLHQNGVVLPKDIQQLKKLLVHHGGRA